MNRPLAQWIITLAAATATFAQPVLRSTSPVANSASYRAAGLPGSGIAQGSIFSIFGDGLGPTPYVQADKMPLPTRLGGTSVTVTVGGKDVPAVIVFAYRTQVNAILPSTTPTGNGSLTVTYNNQTSTPAPIQVVGSAFGIYTYSSWGFGQAIATDPNYQLNSIIRTFHPGDNAILWGTGLGPISSSDADAPPVGNLPGAIKLHVGNATATVSYQGRSGCCSGLDQIVFQVPAGAQGCHVPIAVETGGVVSNIATIAVSASGPTCTDSVMGQDLVDKLAAGNKVDFGYIELLSINTSSDTAIASFSEYTPASAGWAQYGISSGYCVTGPELQPDLSPAQLDAGSALAIQGQTTVSIPQMYAGSYSATLATSPRFLWSGLNYTVSGGGGTKVGAFSATDTTGPAAVQLSGIRNLGTLPLSGDLTIQWTGGDAKLQNGQVTIVGFSGVSTDYTQIVFLQCTAPATAHSFTIPGWVIATLPPSGSGQTGQNGSITYPLGWLGIGQYNHPVAFSAQGLDKGILTDIFINALSVWFQ